MKSRFLLWLPCCSGAAASALRVSSSWILDLTHSEYAKGMIPMTMKLMATKPEKGSLMYFCSYSPKHLSSMKSALSAFSFGFVLGISQRKREFDSLPSMNATTEIKQTPITDHTVTATKLSILKVFGINAFLSDSIQPKFGWLWITFFRQKQTHVELMSETVRQLFFSKERNLLRSHKYELIFAALQTEILEYSCLFKNFSSVWS